MIAKLTFLFYSLDFFSYSQQLFKFHLDKLMLSTDLTQLQK